jgi:diacylglycerol diphosphate phosphatase / phosphatidate phosphatase
MSFAGLTYLALYFSGRLGLFDPHSPHGKHIYSYLLAAAPLLVASFVAASRVSDYRHRGTDVLGGASLGVFFGIMGYRYYFPWPQSQMAGVPWIIGRQEELDIATGNNARVHTPYTDTQLPLLPTTHDARSQGQGSQSTPTPYKHMDNPMELHSIPPTKPIL